MSNKWLNNCVFYQIYPPSFCDSNKDGIGDILGIISKLDYIKDTGFGGIWLNPCFSSPFRDGGYDIDDYKKVAPRYGTNDDLYALFEECHKRNLKIILDLVPGHTSDQHYWFKQSSRGTENEFSSRYVWTESVWQPAFGERYVSGTTERDGNYVINFFNFQPALNYGFAICDYAYKKDWQSKEALDTRNAVWEVMDFWLSKGADGFRVDMADSLVKNDPDKSCTAQVWQDLTGRLKNKYPEAVLVSEWSNPPVSVGKAGFDCDFLLNHANSGYQKLFRDRQGEVDTSYFSKQGKGNIKDFAKEFKSYLDSLCGKGYVSLISGNHDCNRIGRYFSARETAIALCFILTMPSVPFIYYGDELGMKGGKNLPNKEGGYNRTDCRTPFLWSEDKNKGFSQTDGELYLPIDEDSISLEKQIKDDNSTYNTVKKMLALKKKLPQLCADFPFEICETESEYPFIFKRGDLTVIVNPDGKEHKLSMPKGKEIFRIGETGQNSVKAQSFVIIQNEK